MLKKIAFVTYETPFAPCGGIAAVIGRLPGYVKKASGLETIVITPFHHKIEKTSSLKVETAATLNVRYESDSIPVALCKYNDPKTSWSWYFVKPENENFFGGFPNPYLVGDTPAQISANLRRDSLLFGASVAMALNLISSETEWIVLMQDWEAATTALALTNQDHQHRQFLTLHNSYDTEVTDDVLSQIGVDARKCPGETMLERALPLIRRPVFTVSEQFAEDLTSDVLQSEVMADHLQIYFKLGLLGVNNGPFETLNVNKGAVADALKGSFQCLQEWKADNRRNALVELDAVVPSDKTPVWGDLRKFRRDEACWFVMAGRDDPRQKGYDVAAAAVSRFLESGGDARFFFFPIPGDEGEPGLYFLKGLAEKFPENVLVFPFVWREGFFATLRGAAYGVMPSLYEPFGGANEFYLNGTVGIGRATGGLLLQIVPLWSVSSFGQSTQKRSQRWHSLSSSPTGLLFREKDDIESVAADWQGLNDARYEVGNSSNNRVQERMQYSLFNEMANELYLAIQDGARIYQESPEIYYRMLKDGMVHIQNSFSWERAAQEYVRNAV